MDIRLRSCGLILRISRVPVVHQERRFSTCHILTRVQLGRSRPIQTCRGWNSYTKRRSATKDFKRSVSQNSSTPEVHSSIPTATTIPAYSNSSTPNEPPESGSSSNTSSSQSASQGSRKPFHQRLGPFTILFNAYRRNLKNRPLLTQFCSSVVIYFCADISAQTLSRKDDESWDWWRTGRNLVIGGIASLPGYKW
jgi:hypothetical protein